MLFPLDRLLEGRDKPLCVRQDQTIREALSLMVENDYSQLPVVDGNGELHGLVSDESINRRYFHSEGIVSLLDLKVDQCLTPAITLPKDRDIFEALDRLKDVYAIVITEKGKPEGIITNFDMAHFFRDLTEDLLIVEDIETSLRQISQTVLASDEEMRKALISIFGEDKENLGESYKQFDSLTFGNLINLIINDNNWPKFRQIFTPQTLFRQYMDQVRKHRNQLAHFRGRLDAVQHNLLINVQQWLQSRPNLLSYQQVQVQETDIQIAKKFHNIFGISKYDPLQHFLESKRDEGETRISMEFQDIEKLIGEALPESATKHRAWWGNDYMTQAKTWLDAGWLVDGVDMNLEQVSFRQSKSALYPSFFEELVSQLKRIRPGITSASKTSLENWFSFSSGTPGFALGWVLPKESVLRVELYIDSGNRDQNKEAFGSLFINKNSIENEVGESLNWDRLDEHRASRISISKPYNIYDQGIESTQTKQWAVETMLKFIDTFQPRLRKL